MVLDGVVQISELFPEGDSPADWTEFDSIEWLHEPRFAYVGVMEDDAGSYLEAYRPAREDETRRAPEWIQGEEVPECCGLPMFFIGQIWDEALCFEAPDDAELWWHDTAAFYVFTCRKCLGVKAVGQQF